MSSIQIHIYQKNRTFIPAFVQTNKIEYSDKCVNLKIQYQQILYAIDKTAEKCVDCKWRRVTTSLVSCCSCC